MRHRWVLPVTLLAIVANAGGASAQARADRVREIMRISAQPELPLIKAEVIPLQATARVRQRLAARGRALGLGPDWNPRAPEWQEAERRIAPRIREALQAPAAPENARRLEACLQQIATPDVDAIHAVLQSDLWARYRRAVDLTGAIFALMGDVDASLAPARDALSRRITDMAEREMAGNVMVEVQRRFASRGAAECSQLLITDALGRTGALMQKVGTKIDAAQDVVNDAALRFKARRRKS